MTERLPQESFSKYAREEFHLDSLPVHGLVPQDPDTQVINPDWCNRDRELRRRRQALGTLRNPQGVTFLDRQHSRGQDI